MKKRKEDQTKPAGSHPGETKAGMPPERSGSAVDAQPKPDREAGGFPIVGIGASAGGLAAFEAFFSGMPADADPGMAFVLVQHLAPVGYCTLSEKGLILEANLTAATLLGTTRSALVKQPISRFILKEDQDIYYLYSKKLFETGEPRECELQLVKPNGALIWTHLTGTATQAEDGAPVCRCVLSDITERKQAEEALRESEKKYRSILEKIEDGYFEVDLSGNFTFFNDSMCRTLGYSSNELMGMNNRAFMDTENAEKVYNAFNQVFTSGQPLKSFDWELITKDGEKCYVDTSVSLIKNANGEAIGFRGIERDIIERKRAEIYLEMGREILQILNEPGDLQESTQRVLAALKKRTGVDAVGLRLQEGEDFPYFAQDGFSQDFLQTENTLVERGKDGGVCRDKDGNVCLECTCGLVISGKTDPSSPLFTKGGSSWTNDSFPSLDLPSDQDPRLHPRNNCIHQGYTSIALIPVRTSDRIVGLIQLNDKRKGRFTLETIEILESIAAHIGSALMRKQAEEEKEKLQAQLHQAQKMESIATLTGGIAHDYNNLLSIIVGNLGLAMQEAETETALSHFLKEASRATDKVRDLTHELMALSRGGAPVKEVLSLKPVLKNSAKIIPADSGILIEESIKDDLRPVPHDPHKLDAVFRNVLTNAVEAMPQGGTITITAENLRIDDLDQDPGLALKAGYYVKITIGDEGKGLPEEHMDKLFDPYFSTKPMGVQKGMGLGLATAYAIVQKHEGHIAVNSTPGVGTTVSIYLPGAEKEGSKEDSEKSELTSGSKARILVMDDEEMLRNLVQQMLTRLGYEIKTVKDGVEAIEVYGNGLDSHEPFDAVILDLTVKGGMGGEQTIQELVKIDPDIKAIASSGYSNDPVMADPEKYGSKTALAKPYEMKRLKETLEKVL
ncbi:MAG: PAS domain S-box protein [Deltaproteobacteria bacterium]|nr:PAS domain S-box protein [Deltaproteobacteria bacterium]